MRRRLRHKWPPAGENPRDGVRLLIPVSDLNTVAVGDVDAARRERGGATSLLANACVFSACA